MVWSSAVIVAALQLSLTADLVTAQGACSLAPNGQVRPKVASGYQYSIVANGLTKPRGIEFDSAGNLLVIEQNSRLSSHKVQDTGNNCVTLVNHKTLVQDSTLTHAVVLSKDGRTVYFSSADKVFARSYNPDDSSVGSTSTTLIQGMQGADHISRTLLIPRAVDNVIVVSRGSTENVDQRAKDINSGISTVKAYNISGAPSGGYVQASSGLMMGWGLRNEVGIAEHPADGGIWGVENSVDQLTRDGRDVHADNPGEELNFLGYLNGTKAPEQGTNFGYPDCLAAWKPADLPTNQNIKIGTQFTTSSGQDSTCAQKTAPRLTFQAHTAPLDIKFNNSGSEAWISFHGSWNRNTPVGNSVVKVNWNGQTGQPISAKEAGDAAVEILGNQNVGACPYGCLRPAGLAFDSQGRLFVSSDGTGEIYMITKTSGTTSTNDQGSSDATDSDTDTDTNLPGRF